MKLTIEASITASDTGRRIISGKIAPFMEKGYTSAGEVIFERGAIKIPDPSKVKLLAQHQQTASGVIGRMISYSEGADGVYASFRVSKSADGENMLIKASEGILDGLSVGGEALDFTERKDGTMVVTNFALKEVSVVETPAFENARIQKVAAQMTDGTDSDDALEEKIEELEDEAIQQISDGVEKLKVLQTIEKAAESSETENESEAAMSEASTPTEAAKTEAASIKATAPIYGGASTAPRHGITSMGRYVEHKLKAAIGNPESAEWVAASEDRRNINASSDATTSNNPAFNPIQYLSRFVSNTTFGRPTIDAVQRMAAPASGLQINIPSLVTSAGGGSQTAPTVAVNAQGDAPSDTQMTSAYETITLQRYAGQQLVDLSLVERSDPIFMDQLAIQLENAYKAATDAAMIAALTAGGTQAATTAGTTAGLMSFIGTEAPAAYAGSSYFAQNLVTGTGWWSNVISAQDTTGRPLFNTTTPWNSAGDAKPTTIRGSVMGLDYYVDKNVASTLIDESAFIISPEATLWIESPEAFFSVNVVNSMAISTALYGYGAGKVLIPAGVRRFNLT
jgi:HK97 family phage prohead protease